MDEEIQKMVISTEERLRLNEEGTEKLVQKFKKLDMIPDIKHGPNTHLSEKTGNLSGYEIRIPCSTPARCIVNQDFPSARSMYIVNVPEELREKFAANAKSAIDKLKENPLFYDKSMLFETDYHSKREKTASAILGRLGTFFGIYWFTKQVSPTKSDIIYSIIVQNYCESKELEKMVASGATIRAVYESSVYEKAMLNGDAQRNLMAGFILSLCNGEEIAPLTPIITNRYNVIERDGKDDTCVFYDHCYSSWKNENGVLVGHGPEAGFWLFRNIQDSAFSLKDGTDGRTHRFPMGARKLCHFKSGTSTCRTGHVVSWGSTGPNPYSDKNMYEELAFNKAFYLSLNRLGLDYASTAVDVLHPIKVYIASPPCMSPLYSTNKTHLNLKHWLNYPLEDHFVFLPITHPFVLNQFMILYSKYGHSLGLFLKDFIDSEESGKAGIFFNRVNLFKLIRSAETLEYNQILNLA